MTEVLRNIEKTATACIKTPESDQELIELANTKKKEREAFGYIDAGSYPVATLKKLIASKISNYTDQEILPDQINLAPVPPKHEGDYALQIPHLMKADMKSYRGEFLPEVQNLLSDSTEEIPVVDSKLVGPFLNITLNRSHFMKMLLSDIEKKGEHFGEIDLGKGKNVTVEYSSPNAGKSLHVGHLGTTLLGQVYANILHLNGFTVYRVNHLGDWGLPIGLLKVAIEEYGKLPEFTSIQHNTSEYFAALYTRINEESKENPELRERAQREFVKLEAHDPESQEFLKDIRLRSITEMEKFYSYFQISFDAYIGESYYVDDLEKTVEEVSKLDIARQDGKALIIELEALKLDKVLLVKSDGATTYLTRDLAAIKKRHEIFDYNKSYYVVGSEQTTHFRQLFEIASQLGLEYAKDCVHIPIGLLQQQGKKISSRRGGALTPDDLLAATIERAEEQVAESLPEAPIEERHSIAVKVATSAMIYNQILTTPGKNIEFNLDKMLDLRGKTGPYLLYTAVRANSVLNKIGSPQKSLTDISTETFESSDSAVDPLIKQLAQLPEVLNSCYDNNSAHPLAHYAHELAQAINHLYQKVVFKDAEGDLKDFYLHVVKASCQTLTNCLTIMGMQLPERM